MRLFSASLGQSRSLEDAERAEEALALLDDSSASSLLEMSPPSPVVLLARKLMQALECREKFPLYSYDNNPPGNVQGFNRLSKRFKVRVERIASRWTRTKLQLRQTPIRRGATLPAYPPNGAANS